MKKRRLYLGLLTLPLLMANSPMPYPNNQYYRSIETSFTALPSYSEKYRYSMEVKNTGEFYLYTHNDSNQSFTISQSGETIFQKNYMKMDNAIFETQTLKPGSTATYTIELDKTLDEEKSIEVVTLAFELEDMNPTYSEPKVVKDSGNWYKIDTKFSHLGDYYYAIVIDAKYQDKDYSFVVTDSKKFKVNQELDLTKFSIEGMTFYRSSYKTYKGGYFLFGLMMVAELAPYIFLGLIVLAAIIPPAIIIPIRIRRARKQKKLLEESQDK